MREWRPSVNLSEVRRPALVLALQYGNRDGVPPAGTVTDRKPEVRCHIGASRQQKTAFKEAAKHNSQH